MMRKLVRVVGRGLLGLVLFTGLYALAAWLLPMIAVNGNAAQPPDGVPIYILSNGVHTDLVLPLRSPQKDWTTELSFAQTPSQDTAMRYVAFGWGDKGFYLNTPTWADLKASTAFKAMFALSTTAMHVTYHARMDTSDHCRRVLVDRAAFTKLIAYIDASFQRDGGGAVEWIPGHAYERNDAFYEAVGTYNLFFTCNTWANAGLKHSGLKACLWTPLDKGLLALYAPTRSAR